MTDDLADIIAFLHAIPPFDKLPKEQISKLLRLIDICYVRTGEALGANTKEQKLYILRKGSLSYSQKQKGDSELLGKYSEGEICALFCQEKEQDKIILQADEDCLVYAMDYLSFQLSVEDYQDVRDFFSATSEQRLENEVNHASDDARITASLMDTTIEDIYHGPAATIDSSASILEAAQMMTEYDYSSIMVLKQGELFGIVTDKDIRRRCVAKSLPTSETVATIASTNILSIETDKNAFDALILMNAKRIHHLPVTHNSELVGMLTATDVMQKEGQDAIHLTGAIQKAADIDILIEIAHLVPVLQQRLAKMASTANHVGKQITAITNGITSRLIELAIQQLGEAPMNFAWVVAGSQARHEQLCHTDQDNGLILAREPNSQQDKWFQALAKFVCDGLARCGYIYCPGDIMATNKQWRVSVDQWQSYFEQWIRKPTPQALLNSSVFFDLSFVYGDSSLLHKIRKKLLKGTKGNTLLQSHLSRNALTLKPPLGFFRDFVLLGKGENKDTLDLKHSGLAPIIELARIYALSLGIDAVNTLERLDKAAGSRILTQASAKSLIDAFEFLARLRLQHQARQIGQGKAPDNFLAPKDISKLEREYLKDAFKVIKTLQEARQKDF